jgi:hypothetical protein
MMSMSALVRRLPRGKEAEFELTRLGIDWASRIRPEDVTDRTRREVERNVSGQMFVQCFPRLDTTFSKTSRSEEVVKISSHAVLGLENLGFGELNDLRQQLRWIAPEPMTSARENA